MCDQLVISNNRQLAEPGRIGYNGKMYDAASGLYNYGFRDYDPAAGRFTTVDPIRDGMNWFVYTGNDPVNYIDRWGLESRPNLNTGGIRAKGPGEESENGGNWLNNTMTRIGELEVRRSEIMLESNRALAGQIANAANRFWIDVTSFHFEDRDELNAFGRNGDNPLPQTFEEMNSQEGWRHEPLADYHQNGIGEDEVKYTNASTGQEVIFDGDTGELITDPEIMGTFNYVTPAPPPEEWHDVGGWASRGLTGFGHVFTDVLPYGILGGNTR